MLKQIYNYILRLASHPKAELALFLLAFVESSFLPIPPDVLLIPMIIVSFDKAFRYAFICTAGSVLGGILGYAIGFLLDQSVGQAIISFYNAQNHYEELQRLYGENLFLVVSAAGFSPIPYKIFTILSGALHADLATFIFASILSRSARFFLIAWLLWRGGSRFKSWIENNFYPLTMAVTIIAILAVVIFKLIL